jgi:hypothetical protein
VSNRCVIFLSCIAALAAAGCGGGADVGSSAAAVEQAPAPSYGWSGTYVSHSGHAECRTSDGTAIFHVDAGEDGALHFFDGKNTDVGAFKLTSDISVLSAQDPSTGATINSHVRISVGGNSTGQDCNYRFRLDEAAPSKAESVGDGCVWDGQDADGNRLHFVQKVSLETLTLGDSGIHATIASGDATIDIYSEGGAQHVATCAYSQDVQTDVSKN